MNTMKGNICIPYHAASLQLAAKDQHQGGKMMQNTVHNLSVPNIYHRQIHNFSIFLINPLFFPFEECHNTILSFMHDQLYLITNL